MEPRKPKSPLKDKASSNYFYLLTTVDQVVLKDGSRLNGHSWTNENGVTFTGEMIAPHRNYDELRQA